MNRVNTGGGGGAGGGGGGSSAYERGGDARRLAEGCKFRILVSLWVLWAKRHHILPSRSRLGLQAKKYKIFIYCLCFNMISFRGQKKSSGHAQICLL